MKQPLLILLTFLSLFATAQVKNLNQTVLTLNKTGASNTVYIKPNKPIKIKTVDDRKFTLYSYSLIGDSAIVTFTDTIALRNITSIKGTVKGNILRKVGGNVLAAGAGAYGSGAVALGLGTMMSGASLPFFLLAMPALGVTYAGIKLAGPRRFNTSAEWNLSVSPKTE